MSSPTSSRRGRPSKSSTASPASSRARQDIPSSPSFQATPRASRRLIAEGAARSSSPIFFQSSPNKGARSAGTPDVRMDEPSSPAHPSSTLDDGDRTPRGNQEVRGMGHCTCCVAEQFRWWNADCFVRFVSDPLYSKLQSYERLQSSRHSLRSPLRCPEYKQRSFCIASSGSGPPWRVSSQRLALRGLRVYSHPPKSHVRGC